MGKVNDANGFTPLSASTIDLWNQMITIDPTTGKFGPLTSQWGNADDTFGKKTDGSDGHYPTDSTGDKQTTNLNDPFADLSENVNQPKSLYGTGLGRSLVMNSPFQFNPNDDVRSDSYFPHLGRVFNEKIYSNYPIAIFEVGHIKYNNSLLSGTVVDDGQTDQ